MIYIYELFDTKVQVPVYVGATKDKDVRFRSHLNTTLKDYVNKDFVEMKILEECVIKKAKKAEQKWYEYYINKGVVLLNSSTMFYRTPLKNGYTVYETALLATAFGKSMQTINRWIKSKDDRLTSDKAKAALVSTKRKTSQDY